MSEIDEIFSSSKNKRKAPAVAPQLPEAPPKKRKLKKLKAEKIPLKESSGHTDHVPKTVYDPSTPKSAALPKSDRKKKLLDRNDEDTFKNSRGTQSRRKTEEGWNIYKEDELGIREGGGGKPLGCIVNKRISYLLRQTRLCALLTVIAVFDTPCDTTRSTRQNFVLPHYHLGRL